MGMAIEATISAAPARQGEGQQKVELTYLGALQALLRAKGFSP